MAKLSIIVPVYNKEQYLDNCIQSILAQTFTDFELLLINDGSTDKSGDKCNSYQSADSRVRVLHQLNQGVSAARNAGIAIARGIYVGFIDSDDVIEKDMYEMLIENAKSHDAEISICGVKKIFSNKEQLFYGTKKLKEYSNFDGVIGLLRKEFSGSANDRIFAAELAKSAKFEGGMNEDIYYNFRLLIRAKKIVFYDEMKYYYYVRDNSASMAKFNKKHMDAVFLSQQILKICKRSAPLSVQEEATYFDIVTNISTLNLILLNGKKKYINEYNIIKKNLEKNFMFIGNSKLVTNKHKIAYYLFSTSPALYAVLMKLYCLIFDAEALKSL